MKKREIGDKAAAKFCRMTKDHKKESTSFSLCMAAVCGKDRQILEICGSIRYNMISEVCMKNGVELFAKSFKSKNRDCRSHRFDTASFFRLFWVLLGQPGKGMDGQHRNGFRDGYLCRPKACGAEKPAGG